MITTRNCTVLMTFNEKCFRNQLQSSQLKCTVCTCCIDVSEKTSVPTEQYMCPWKQGPAKCFSLSEDEKCSAQIAVDTVVDLPKKEKEISPTVAQRLEQTVYTVQLSQILMGTVVVEV